MKKIITLSILSSFFATSCMTMQGPKPIVLVDAPKDMTVNHNGINVNIEDVVAIREERTSGNVKNVTLYKYPGVKIKLKKYTKIGLKSGDKKCTVKIKTRPAIGILILETIFTCGIGTIVDLATGAYWVTNSKFVDVPAELENSTSRDQKTLRRKVKNEFN